MLFLLMQDSRVFPACRILIGQFKFEVRQPYARGFGAVERETTDLSLSSSSPEHALLLVCTKNRDISEGSKFRSTRREFVSNSQPLILVRLDSEHAQSDGKSVDSVADLDLPRGRDSWC